MRSRFLVTSIALGAAIGTLSAQTLTPSDSTKVTAIGCVAHANTQAPTGTSGSAAQSSYDTKFVLTIPIAGTTAEVSGTAPAASNVRYRLDDVDQVKVAAHLGHKVEIAGTIEASANQGEHKSSDAAQANPPKLKVQSIREISSLCVP